MTISSKEHAIKKLAEFNSQLAGEEMVRSLVPPPQFSSASFENYRPDSYYPSQAEAQQALSDFALSFGQTKSKVSFFAKKSPAPTFQGIYLDGGFGVGKTHLLASLWHAAPGPKRFGTFLEYTALVGAVGYNEALKLLGSAKLICIDEFELDDPGDTMLMTRLLGALADGGTKLAATSNTPPNALGEGRFAAADFLREIQGLSSRFKILRIDGQDYRRRETDSTAVSFSESEFEQKLQLVSTQKDIALSDWSELLKYLAEVHPARYVKIASQLPPLFLSNVSQLHSQTDALRFVAFIDRLYDAQVPIINSGISLDEVFDQEMMAGGYRKKYLRAVSRLISLTSRANSMLTEI